ncbi:MAG: hypothetical protein CSA13_02215 [Clostridiales bacterium]|nr:MAG: hypothetical protein CSA13_02215 [Clostridiales bacterium]
MIGKKLAGRYEIIEAIGDGGMSIVYRGHCHVLNRPVAIKILKEEFVDDAVFVKRFDQEAKSAASIQHANIVNVYDVGIEDDIHYIVMELLSDRTLKDYIEEQKVYLNTESIVRIGLQIAEALQVAHDKGIVHRDIKPQNILMTQEGNVKVADFGIARAVTSSTMVNTKEAVGSVHYSSPEQSRAGFVDKRSDIYSFGILLYELATGRVPFVGDTPIAIALKHLKEQPIPPHLINMHLNPALEALILKCISKDPINRYQNVYEIIERLETLQRNPDEAVVFDEVADEDKFSTRVLPKIGADLEQNAVYAGAAVSAEEQFEINGEDEKSGGFVIKPLFIIAVILGVIFASVFLASTFRGRGNTSAQQGDQSFELMKIEGMNYEEAAVLLSEKGLAVEVTEYRYSDSVAADVIISQKPKAETTVKSGQTIALVVSKGAKQIELPNLMGKTVDEARVILSNVDATLGEIKPENSDYEEGLIFSQTPVAGTAIESGAVVNIMVSTGVEVEQVVVPDIVGKTKNEALRLLENADLIYGAIDTEHSDTVEEDRVISQAIKAGEKVDEKTIVNFVISLGVDPATVSDTIDSGGKVTKTFRLPLDDQKSVQVIEVKKVVDGKEEVLYGKIHRKEEGVVVLNITGEGKQILRFYIDQELVEEREVDFSKE